MSVQKATLELSLDGSWVEVPLHDTPVVVERGTDPYSGSWPSPSNLSCQINNTDLNYDPSNPEAVIYGVAGRNTLCRLQLNDWTGLTAEVAQWTPDRSPAHHLGGGRGRASTGVYAAGVSRRVDAWTEQLKSTMHTTYAARSTSLGHWPCEDNRLVTALGNTLPGGPAATVTGDHSLGDAEAPLGAASSLRMSADHAIDGNFAPASITAGWQIVFSFRFDALPADSTYRNIIFWRTNNGYGWTVQANDSTYRLVVVDPDGGLSVADAFLYGDGREPTQWITLRCKTSESGGTVTAEVAWFAEGEPDEVGFTSMFSGAQGALLNWGSRGSANSDGGWLCHVQGVTGGTDDLVGATAQDMLTGFLGELTTTRFLRLCAQRGIDAYLIGDESDGTPMGPQRPGTLVGLLRQIRDTEDGRIDDVRSLIALALRTRRSLLAQDPALELTFFSEVSPPFWRIIDDKPTANHVTAADALGAEQVASLDTGPMSTAASPDGVGEYRKTVEVSVSDTVFGLADIANWHLAKGTIEAPRYSTLVVNVIANPHLAEACAGLGLGSLITLAGFEPDLLRLLVVKVTVRLRPGVFRYEFDTELYEPYNAGRWDEFRWDARTSVVDGPHSAVATSLALTTDDPDDVWSTSMAGVDLDVEGERVTVVTMGAVSGSGPYTQTVTVLRSVNGVRKPQKDGARVRLADGKRWGL